MISNTAAESSPQSATIIEFPRSQRIIDKDPLTIFENLMMMKVLSVEEALGFIVPTLFEAVISSGFTVKDDKLSGMVVAALRAIMYNHYDLDHPLTTFLEEHEDEITNIIENQTNNIHHVIDSDISLESDLD